MTANAEFTILYDGQALQSNEMDVRELAPALLSLAEVLEQANRILNGEKLKIAVNVKGSFKAGSFGIEFSVVQSLISQINDFFNSRTGSTVVGILTVLGFCSGTGKGLLWFLKWLRKRPIKNIKLLENSNAQIFVDDEQIEVEQAVLELYRDYKLRQALSEVITKPLEKPGINSFAVKYKNEDFFIVEKEERDWFAGPLPEEEVVEDRIDTERLQVISVTFRDGNKWRFTDGTSTFHASILDEGFLRRVERNEEHFAKDDVFEVKVRKRRWIDSDGVMKSEYEVIEIISHQSAVKQLKLPFQN